MTEMVSYGHSRGLTVGFYSNNCACSDHCSDPNCFSADVEATLNMGFDSIKLDGCGKEENVELWRSLFNYSIGMRQKTNPALQPMLIENCHNGPNVPTSDWCPFHMYRSSTDIRPVFGSILANLQTIMPLQSQNLSTPGCWAYPDMLEVGVMNTQSSVPPLSVTEARSHFGAWAIVSSPLIIGANVTDAPTMEFIWPIISNTEAIAVNQEYAGDSGTIIYSSAALTFFEPCG